MDEPPAKKQRLEDTTSIEEAPKEDRRDDLRKRGIAPVKPEYVNRLALDCDCRFLSNRILIKFIVQVSSYLQWQSNGDQGLERR